ncbi:RNA methyltransferase [Desulfosarcina ovata subsp. ovata]|uniref:RNA methyltransferase n=2 Tax=Desulfosarcina ovata TaxID=83564 RepID=A0A5K8ABK3_9BACT|nr:RNA methyltransferase [Desulfosarcina ovata subsp. ovata]
MLNQVLSLSRAFTMNEEKETIRSRALEKRIRRHVAGRTREYFAAVPPGFEAGCRQELIDLGLDPAGVTVEAGGIGFTGRLMDCLRANLYLRTATRVLMRIGDFRATNRRRLEKKSAEIAWELFLEPGPLPAIKVSSHRSRLYHTAAIAQTIRSGIARRLNAAPPSSPGTGIPQTLFARLVEDRLTLSLDSSGEPLYKRGFKMGAARAPLRETLAAAILMAAGYDPSNPLVDPMCGSGSFSLEAAMQAKHMAPGVNRPFAFQGWPAYSENQWAFLKREAEEQVVHLDRPRIFASDIDAGACARLSKTIAGNAMDDAVRVTPKNIFDCRGDQYGEGPGLVTINPPYGIRIGSATQAGELFMAIGRHLGRHFKGWQVALIAPERKLAHQLPFAAKRLPLLHGGLKLTLVVGTINA